MNNPVYIQVRKLRQFKRRYEFFAGEKELAVLDYEKRTSKRATAIKDNKKWSFNRIGFWKPYIEITAEQSPYTKSRIQYGWNYKLKFKASNGKEYLLKKTSHWRNTWAWLDENNNPVVEMKSCQLSKSNRGQVNIIPGQLGNDDFFLLMLLGWYQLIAHEDHAGAAVVVT
jgi:hypothetical protein